MKKMEFDEYGDRQKETVVLLHGAGCTDSFCNQYVFQKRYHLVVPHLPGSGRAVAETYEPEETIAALAAFIRSLGRERVAVIGHSLGGELAVALVSRFPELFSKAVFLSAWVCASQGAVNTYVRLAKASVRMLKVNALVAAQAKYWNMNGAQAAFLAEYSRKITPEQYASWFQKRIQLDQEAGYPAVQIPMLAICGAAETPETRRSLAELGKRNPNCMTLLLPRANHDFPQRRAEALNPILLSFLDQ